MLLNMSFRLTIILFYSRKITNAKDQSYEEFFGRPPVWNRLPVSEIYFRDKNDFNTKFWVIHDVFYKVYLDYV